MTLNKIKICCISSLHEAQLAIKHGATDIGLVGPMPSGPGIIDNHLIREIASAIPKHIHTFLLTSETTAHNIINHHKQVNTTTIQMVDKVALDQYQIIRAELPDIKLVQVVHVMNEDVIQEAKSLEGHVDYILLDSGNPNLAIKVLGGTGKTHNWAISAEIVKSVETPVYLAGGLHSENVKAAIESVQPYGVDLCSGVRTKGKLDEDKLKSFIDVARNK